MIIFIIIHFLTSPLLVCPFLVVFFLPLSSLFLGNSPAWVPSCRSCLVVGLAVKNSQNGQEQVDDVKIQADGGGNLFLDVVVLHHHLGVDENIGAEEQSRNASVDQLGSAAVGEEHGHEAEEDQGPETSEKVGHPRCEIVFCLAGEGCEEDENACSEDHGVEDDGCFVERYDDGDGIGFGEGEER